MLTISALDIFASALGVFMLVSILIFPNYLKQPAIEAEQAGARAELAAAADDLTHARQAVADALQEKAAAATTLAEAKARLVEAEALAARAAQQPEPQEIGAPAEPQTRGEQKVRIAIADLDLVFVVDTTGSMRRELADLQANLIGIIRVLSRLASSLRDRLRRLQGPRRSLSDQGLSVGANERRPCRRAGRLRERPERRGRR